MHPVFEEYVKEFKVLCSLYQCDRFTFTLPNFKDLMLTSGAWYHTTPSEVSWSPRLDGSELFQQHEGGQHNIRIVILKLRQNCVKIFIKY